MQQSTEAFRTSKLLPCGPLMMDACPNHRTYSAKSEPSINSGPGWWFYVRMMMLGGCACVRAGGM